MDWFLAQTYLEICGAPPLDQMHPFSLEVLNLWWRGLITFEQFNVNFSLPNSSYLGIPQCLWNALVAVPGLDA